jgi:CTP synthase
MLKDLDGVIVPGGFGNRGIEGMITTIKYVRENGVPFLGICLGMQMSVVEFARNVLKFKDANSEEFDETSKHQVIHIMEDQKIVKKKGGTMRLGAYPCKIKPKTLAYEIYGETSISQRHRHRFEFNNKFREKVEKAGMKISGTSPNNLLVEIVEIPSHPFFIAGQFHPEFKSRPDRPEPLFRELVKAAKKAKYRK